MGQIHLRQKLLHQFLSKLPLHKRIGRNLPRKPVRTGQLENPLHERHGQRILPMANLRIPHPARPIHRLVLHRDIRRIRHHRMVRPNPQNPPQRVPILRLVPVGNPRFRLQRQTFLVQKPLAVEQRIPAGQIQRKIRTIRQPPPAARRHCPQQQPELGNPHREGIDIHPVDAPQRPVHQFHHRSRRFPPLPPVQNPVERPQQKMARPAGGIDHPKPRPRQRLAAPPLHRRGVQPKLFNRRFQGPIQNKRLHKIRRLEQRVLLLGQFGKILVQIRQKPRIPFRVRKIVDQLAGLRIDPLKKGQQLPGHVAAQPAGKQMDGIVRPENLLPRRQGPNPLERRQQILPIRLLGMFPKKQLVLVPGPPQPISRPGNPGRVHQRVVFQKPRKHARQNPGRRLLGDLLPPPFLKRHRRPLRLPGLLVFRRQPLVKFGPRPPRLRPLPQVRLHPVDQLFQIRQQPLSIHKTNTPFRHRATNPPTHFKNAP